MEWELSKRKFWGNSHESRHGKTTMENSCCCPWSQICHKESLKMKYVSSSRVCFPNSNRHGYAFSFIEKMAKSFLHSLQTIIVNRNYCYIIPVLLNFLS